MKEQGKGKQNRNRNDLHNNWKNIIRENSSSLCPDVFQWETLHLVHILSMTKFYVQSFLRKDLFVKLRRDPKNTQPLQWTILNS